MISILTSTGPWLFAIALTGLVVGATNCVGSETKPATTDDDRFLAGVWLFCLILVLLRVVEGRPGLWIEIGVVFTGVYATACVLGARLRRTLYPVERTPADQG